MIFTQSCRTSVYHYVITKYHILSLWSPKCLFFRYKLDHSTSEYNAISVISRSRGCCNSDFFFTGPANAFQAQNNYSFYTPLVWIPSAYLQAIGSEV